MNGDLFFDKAPHKEKFHAIAWSHKELTKLRARGVRQERRTPNGSAGNVVGDPSPSNG